MVTSKRITSISQILKTKDYIVLDTETTGLSPDTDRIIEIGMVRVVNDEMVNRNGTFINPERPISASASKVNGIKADDVKQAPTYAQIAPSIARLLIGNTVVAHNADFDLRFICRMLSDAGFDGEIRFIDTLRLSRDLFPEMDNYKLGTLCDFFEIDPGNAHRAIDDSVACYHILQQCKARALAAPVPAGKKIPESPHPSFPPVSTTSNCEPASSSRYVVDRSYTNRIYTPSELISPALKRKIKKGDVLSLRKEPSNKYDRKAVAVYWKHKKIGYLYQNGLRDIVMEYWKKKYPVEITFVSFSSNKSDESATADFKFFKPNDASSTKPSSKSSPSTGGLSSTLTNLPIWVWILAVLLLISSCNSLINKATKETPSTTEHPAVVEAFPSPAQESVTPTPEPVTTILETQNTTVPNLIGEWKQVNSNSETSYQVATVNANSIEVYWFDADGESKSLYWIGTFVPPTTSDEPYSWESVGDISQMEFALMASTDETKLFTYENGQITYSTSILGVTSTTRLERN